MLSSDLKDCLGDFQEKDFGHWFSYYKSSNDWGISHGLPHEIATIGGKRSANVLKTVAYVSVDEGPDGKPIVEKWHLKKNHPYGGH